MDPASTLPDTLSTLTDVSIGGDAFLLLLYVLLALMFSFLCSVAEATLLSITPSYIAGLRETQPKKAEMLKQLKPKLDSAVEEVIKKGGFDLVFERGAVIDVKPQYDITRQVIERMNQLK